MMNILVFSVFVVYLSVMASPVLASPVRGPYVNINRTNIYDRGSPVFGSPKWDSGFDGDRAKSYVYVLASDSLGGRYSGFIGTDKADKYITDHFRNLGLTEPFVENGYFHNFTYGAGEYKMPSSLVVKYPDGKVDSAFMWQDFNIYKYSGFGKVSGIVVFAGFGVSAPEKGWDDYADIDVMGKIVLVTRGLPAIDTIDWNREGSSGFKSTTALQKGAIGFMMTLGNPPKYATIQDEYFRAELPAVWISETLADNILGESGKTIQDLRKEINYKNHSVSLELEAAVSMQVSGEYYPERPTRNIAGILPGSDPELRHEVIIIGAHMDHHGIDAAGNLYPGADDNASGAAAMMELATVFSSKEHRPKRSIMFMGFAAEEEGLVGSKAFVESLPMDGYDVVAMLNMDMVGVGSGEIGVGGLDQFPPLEGMLAGNEYSEAWQDSSLEKIAFWGLHGSSDHAAFMDAGIPSYVIGARGSHPNYHTPNDTAGAIQPEVLKAVGDMMYHCALYLADNVLDLKDYSDRAWHLMRKYPRIISISHGNTFHKKRRIGQYHNLKGVPYAKPTIFLHLSKFNHPRIKSYGLGSGSRFGDPDRISNGMQYIIEHLQQDLAESKEISGMNADDNISFIIKSPYDIPSTSSRLKRFKKIGVDFVEVSPNGPINLDELSDLELKEFSNVCRRAGIRPWSYFYYPTNLSGVKRVANIWGNQMVLVLQSESWFWDKFEDMAGSGIFIIINDSGFKGSEKAYDGLLEALSGKYSASIALKGDVGAYEKLLELGVSEHDIKNLMTANFERRMKLWEADSSFYHPELWTNAERKIIKAVSHRKWWLQ